MRAGSGLLIPLAGLLGLVLTLGLTLAASDSRRWEADPAYPLATVRAQLEHDSRHWVGRTVTLRAIVVPCPWAGEQERLVRYAGRSLVLIGLPSDPPAIPLPLVQPAPHPLLSWARRLPIVGGLLPRSAAVPLLVPERFRVRLLALPAGSCAGQHPCYAALWLDGAPGTL